MPTAKIPEKRTPLTRVASKATTAVERALRLYGQLVTAYPDAHCELEHLSPFQLLVATVLSAQTTDVAVNKVTPELFRRYPDAAALGQAPLVEVETLIGSIGMYRQKAKHIIGLSQKLELYHKGEVPSRLSDLVALPGVGRKTANVVLGVAFGTPEGVVVDTHVQRLAQRLGFTRETEPESIERALMTLFPKSEWDRISHTLIFHGRRCCSARSPVCADCPVVGDCPSAHRAEEIGRKSAKPRAASKSRALIAKPAVTGVITRRKP